MSERARFDGVAQAMLEAARPLARQYFRARLDVDHKADQSPVTIADRSIEQAMTAVLRQHLPDHGYFGEEHGSTGIDRRYVWVIDPIDGTKSFVSGVPLFGTLIALLEHGRPVMGVIDMPVLGECWTAWSDGPVLLGGATCRTSGQTRLDACTLFATSPDQFTPEETLAFERLSSACRARRFGGDCYSYALLASGHIDLILEAELQPYDYLPLTPIIEAAGGKITDWNGRDLDLSSDGRVLAAATPSLHAAALARLRRDSVALPDKLVSI